MRLGLVAAALMAAASLSSMAQATKFNFTLVAGGGDPTTPFMTGNGWFETAGSNGTFTLASGLQHFGLFGYELTPFAGGFFALPMGNLTSFSATLDHGALTALSFGSASFPVVQKLYGFIDIGIPDAHVQLSASGLDPANFSFTTDIGFDPNIGPVFGTVGPITGNLVISPAPEPSSWALMLGGFGLVGGAMRTRRRQISFA
jgi:hypothetical protein